MSHMLNLIRCNIYKAQKVQKNNSIMQMFAQYLNTLVQHGSPTFTALEVKLSTSRIVQPGLSLVIVTLKEYLNI